MQLFAESKVQALDVKINLPVIPRLRRAVTDDEVKKFYFTSCEKVFQAAANSLTTLPITAPRDIEFFAMLVGR